MKRVMTAFAFTLFAVACGGAPESTASPQVITLDGSSTVFPIGEAVAEEFQRANAGARVTVGTSGTGGGFQKFCRGETDISNASRPIKDSEAEACKAAGITFIQLPVAYDGLSVVVNPKNTWAASVTAAELKRLWQPEAQGAVMRWSQIRAGWPYREIHLYGPGTDSGTFDYFTEAIVGKAQASRGEFTASEDDNVLVQGVSSDENALGYFGFAYYAENRDKLKAVPIVAKEGKPAVAPSMEAVINGSYQALWRPIFVYVSAKALQRPEVKEFVEFYNKNAEKLTKEVKYVPLPAKAYAHNLETVSKNKLGTKFGGENKVGLTIEELMTLEAQL